jgi:hypothetical protein
MAVLNSRFRSCFITAPAGTNLDILTRALARRDIRVVGPKDIPVGTVLEMEISKLLASADLIIGVLTPERLSDWVLFELGQAWGQGKTILLFAPPGSAHVPSTLRRFVTFRTTVSNQEAVEFALDQILAAPEPTHAPDVPARKKTPLGASANRYRRGNETSFVLANPLELESLVAKALQEAGVDVLARSQVEDGGADLAIWSDELQPFVGNPLLVEIKTELATPMNALIAAQKFSRNVTASGGLWGLLLYGKGPKKIKLLPQNVLAMPIETLFLKLRSESFDRIVRDLRSRRVHGVGS